MNDSIGYLSVVIPVFNAENHIENTINTILIFLKEQSIFHEIILVNDNSTDTTATILTALANQNKELKIITNDTNIGQDSSTLIGIHATAYPLVLMIDDDFEYHANSILMLIKTQIENNADVVYGIPIYNKSNIVRKIAHTIGHQLIQLVGLPDASNYKLITGNTLTQLKITPVEKHFNLDKYILKKTAAITHIRTENEPNNNSRYNLHKLVMKTFNFIFYSR